MSTNNEQAGEWRARPSARRRRAATSAVGLQAGRAARGRPGPHHGIRPRLQRMTGAREPRRGRAARRRHPGDAAPLGHGRRWCPADADGAMDRRRASPTRGSSRGCASAATRWTTIRAGRPRRGKLAFGLHRGPAARRAREVDAGGARPRETGLEPALIERIFTAMGFGAQSLDRLTEDDVQLLRYVGRGARRRASRSSPSCSSSASTARRWRRSPTPRCGSSTSTSTSR